MTYCRHLAIDHRCELARWREDVKGEHEAVSDFLFFGGREGEAFPTMQEMFRRKIVMGFDNQVTVCDG